MKKGWCPCIHKESLTYLSTLTNVHTYIIIVDHIILNAIRNYVIKLFLIFYKTTYQVVIALYFFCCSNNIFWYICHERSNDADNSYGVVYFVPSGVNHLNLEVQCRRIPRISTRLVQYIIYCILTTD